MAPPVSAPVTPPPPVPLVVDLDGTLLAVTSRTTMVVRLVLRSPRSYRRYRGLRKHDRHGSKMFLWDTVGVDLDLLSLRQELLDRIEAEARSGRPVFLASGAPHGLVLGLVDRYPFLAGGWGSGPEVGLTGHEKAALLVSEFGEAGFDYVGDAVEDLPVWRRARGGTVVWPGRRLRRLTRTLDRPLEVDARPPAAALRLGGLVCRATVVEARARTARAGLAPLGR